jgi:hypothetical protein
MPRRSWRDLDRAEGPASPAAGPAATQDVPRGPGDLEAAAALVPDSRLNTLMEERRALEDRLRNLTGLPGQQGTQDPHRDARFQVPSFGERQAEIRRWEARRQARMTRRQQDVWRGSERWAHALQSAREEPPALPAPASGLGATGLSDRMRALRGGLTDRSRAARESLLARPREVAGRIDEAGRPLRQLGEQLKDRDRQLEEMDRKLAAEGISEAERQEIREAVSSDAVDKVSAVLGRANRAIDAPKKAVARIEQFWERREQQISGPMDRFSGYAADRERRLSTETGGSGDLFQRMQANRMSALRRRQESRMQERREERRRERARERASERRAEERRPDE